MENFVRHLGNSPYFAVDVHAQQSRIGMVVFCFKETVMFVIPPLFPDTTSAIGRALRRNPKTVIAYRWHRRGQEMQKLFEWEPSDVVMVEDVAREKGLEPTLDAMAEEVVGGKMCRRGSFFGASAVPSAIALEHRAIRVTLIRDFVVKLRGMRKPEEDRSRSQHNRYRAPDHRAGSKRAREHEGRDVGRSKSGKRDDKSSRR